MTEQTQRTFRSQTDYKAAFAAAVTKLIERQIPDRQARIKAIDALINEYVEAVGERPDKRELYRLANEILREELTDRHPDKVAKEEYSILSDKQLERRKYGRRGREYTNMKGEVSIPHSLASDGRDYRIPRRRKRSVNEDIIIERKTLPKNDEKLKKYKEFIKPSNVITYKTDDLRTMEVEQNTKEDPTKI